MYIFGYLSVYSLISLSSSHHHPSFNHLEMCRLVFFINVYLYDVIIYPIFIHLYLFNNQHLSSDHFEMHRICLFVCFFLSLWLHNYLSSPTARKNMSIYPSIYLSSIFQSLQTNPFTYVYINLYIFLKSVFLRHPVLLSFSMYVICMSSKSVSLLRANAPQSTCLSTDLQRRLDSS